MEMLKPVVGKHWKGEWEDVYADIYVCGYDKDVLMRQTLLCVCVCVCVCACACACACVRALSWQWVAW